MSRIKKKDQSARIATQRRFIAEMRAMHPDAVMSRRLDDLESELDALEGKHATAV